MTDPEDDPHDAGAPAGSVVAERLRPIADIRGDTGQVSGAALIGGCCRSCNMQAFPMRGICMGCGGRDVVEMALPLTGTLYSFTTVHVSSSRPTPYAVGYVDLDNGVRLLASIDGPAGRLICGAAMRLDVQGYAWRFVPGEAL